MHSKEAAVRKLPLLPRTAAIRIQFKLMTEEQEIALKLLDGHIDMEQAQFSKTVDKIPAPDMAISMGCEVGCPYIGRDFDCDWGISDPTGESDERFTETIKHIEEHSLAL